MSINILTLSGNLGKDPEIKYFESGTSVCKFSLAGQVYKNKQNETVWIDCEVWGKLGETIASLCTKGSQITVVGEFYMNEWEGQNGKVSRPTCIVRSVQLPRKENADNLTVGNGIAV